MRMTSRKKEILSYYEPDSLEWVTREIGVPPFDVSGMAYLIHGMESFGKRYQLESTRRTLENMAAGGLLEKVTFYERRQNITQSSADAPGVWCNVTRYGLPGKCGIYRDICGREALEGEAIKLDVPD